ncbi:unnamed protein product [Rhizoctonia solani]|uniref:Uncharacterized protein n=1 Tax=Rhizoctonia solani TaxID=456999 RepID=A0A8H3A126_9AGAM|nr:unnamed protein product [Rhizoctonia solani]
MSKAKSQRTKRSQVTKEPDVQANTSTSGRRVVEIQELLVLITHELEAKQRRDLMRVSKHFFRSIGPIAWRNVPRLDIIMRLVKNIKVKLGESWADYKWQFMITLPRNSDFSRYDLYAPWVQELELYGGYYVEVTNPRKLPSFFNGRVPLPNLQRLTASTSAPIGGKDLVDFFDTFVCPSLTELRTVIPNKGLPVADFLRVVSSDVPALLQKIKVNCPQIQVLEFYPDGMARFDQLGNERYVPTAQCKSVLQSFSSLRSFSSTTYILKPEIIGILGSLPCLESLGIRGMPTEPSVLDEELSIPETWFLVLKHLRLYEISPDDIKSLWNQPTIAKKLRSALFQIDYLNHRHPEDSPLFTENWLGPFLEALPQLSPQLQDISLYIGGLDNMTEIPRNMWNVFKLKHDLDYLFYGYKACLARQDAGTIAGPA